MIALKKRLIEEIEKIQDNEVIDQLSQLIVGENESKVIEFSVDQIKKIKDSQVQMDQGEFISHNELMQSIGND